MCRTCNCEEANNSCFKECCDPVIGMQPISTSSVFYKLENMDNPTLKGLDVGNGTPLNTILELITTQLNDDRAYNYSAYNIPFLSSKYIIKINKDFAEAVSGEFGSLNEQVKSLLDFKTTFSLKTNLLEEKVESIYFPKIEDNGYLGFTINSNIRQVLQIVVDRLSDIIPSSTGTNTPILTQSTSSIRLTSAGVNKHTLSASVILSAQSNNALQTLPDGLYVPLITPNNSSQTLSLSGMQLSISGGNTVNLPTPVLSLNGTQLSISGGNSVDLVALSGGGAANTPITTNASTTISIQAYGTNSHTLQASLLISNTAGNTLSVVGNGAYVPTPSAGAILTQIEQSAPLKTQLNSLVNSSVRPSYSYYVTNLDVDAIDFVYRDSQDVEQVREIPGGGGSGSSVLIINVWKVISTPTSNFVFTFLGNT